MANVDPYEIFDLPRNFSLEMLRSRYRKLALQTHPDRNNGERALFDVVSACYETLYLEFARRTDDRQHADLKSEYVSKRAPTVAKKPRARGGSRFDVDKFNADFEKHRMPDRIVDGGYEEWMRSNAPSAETDARDAFRAIAGASGRFQTSKFNAAFDARARSAKGDVESRAIVAVPQPMVSSALGFSELGAGKPSDYGSGARNVVDESRRAVSYSDYKHAHTDGALLVDPRDLDGFRERRSVGLDAYERERARSLAVEQSAEEERALQRARLEEENAEIARLRRLESDDAARARWAQALMGVVGPQEGRRRSGRVKL
jgi:hypothetical protein